MTQAKSIMYRQ